MKGKEENNKHIFMEVHSFVFFAFLLFVPLWCNMVKAQYVGLSYLVLSAKMVNPFWAKLALKR